MGILFFTSVIGYAAGLRKLFPKMKMGAALLTAACFMVFLSYLTVILFGLYPFGAYFVILSGFAALLASAAAEVYDSRKNRRCLKDHLEMWKRQYLTPSMCVFLLIAAEAAYSLRGMTTLSSHDNYSFWGRAVREMWFFDASYFNASSNIFHGDYCAAIPSLQYSVVKVFGWKNEYLCYIPVTIIAAALAAVYDRFTWKNKWCVLFGTVSLLVLYPMTSCTFDFDELLLDGPLAMLFAAALISWVEREDDSFGTLLPVMAAAFVLVTAKPYTGLMLAAVLLAAIFIYWLRNRKAMHYAAVTVMALLIVFAQFSWSAYYNYYDAVSQYWSNTAQNEYLDVEKDIGEEPTFKLSYIIKGNPRNSKLTDDIDMGVIRENLRMARPHIMSIFTEKLNGAASAAVTVFSMSVFTAIAMAVTAYLASGELRKRMLYSVRIAGAAVTVYIIGTLVTVFVVQPQAVSSIIRYAGITLIIVQNILFFYLSSLLAEGKKETMNFAAMIIAAMVLFVSPAELFNTYFLENSYPSDGFALSVVESAAGMIDDSDRILYIDNRRTYGQNISASGLVYCYQYHAFPNYADAVYHPYGNTDEYETIDAEWLNTRLVHQRANKLVIRADDPRCIEKYAEILGVNPSVSQPWVFSVEFRQGVPEFVLMEAQG